LNDNTFYCNLNSTHSNSTNLNFYLIDRKLFLLINYTFNVI